MLLVCTALRPAPNPTHTTSDYTTVRTLLNSSLRDNDSYTGQGKHLSPTLPISICLSVRLSLCLNTSSTLSRPLSAWCGLADQWLVSRGAVNPNAVNSLPTPRRARGWTTQLTPSTASILAAASVRHANDLQFAGTGFRPRPLLLQPWWAFTRGMLVPRLRVEQELGCACVRAGCCARVWDGRSPTHSRARLWLDGARSLREELHRCERVCVRAWAVFGWFAPAPHLQSAGLVWRLVPAINSDSYSHC